VTERYDHRDADARAADTQEAEVIDTPMLDGADDLQTEATRALDDAEGAGRSDRNDSVEG